jgi:hypothetical protein
MFGFILARCKSHNIRKGSQLFPVNDKTLNPYSKDACLAALFDHENQLT